AYWTREKRKWPVDLMGGGRHSARWPTLTVDPKLRQTILDTACTAPPPPPSMVGARVSCSGLSTHCLSRRTLKKKPRPGANPVPPRLPVNNDGEMARDHLLWPKKKVR